MSQKNSYAAENTAKRELTVDRTSRRTALKLALAGTATLLHPLAALAVAVPSKIAVWKTASCGCCKAWVTHLRSNGFDVVTHDVADTAPVRQKLGLPARFGSCHTAQLDGYVLEGHVPAQEIQRLLKERPKALGLAVPGMPIGSPGMEMDGARDAFDVLLVLADGSSQIYQAYSAKTAIKS